MSTIEECIPTDSIDGAINDGMSDVFGHFLIAAHVHKHIIIIIIAAVVRHHHDDDKIKKSNTPNKRSHPPCIIISNGTPNNNVQRPVLLLFVLLRWLHFGSLPKRVHLSGHPSTSPLPLLLKIKSQISQNKVIPIPTPPRKYNPPLKSTPYTLN